MSQQETLKTSLEFMDPGARCFAKGVPRMHMNNPAFFEFVFTPTTLFILHEQNHVYEIIPLDGSPRLSKNIKLWMGDQRGHWEGDTLVVETTNHNGRSWIDDQRGFRRESTLSGFFRVGFNHTAGTPGLPESLKVGLTV